MGLRAIGIPDIEDFSSGNLVGSHTALRLWGLMIRQGLQAAFGRNEFPNLALYIHTLGSKIVLNDSRTATDVIVKSAGTSYLLNATKEVIVSAGAF